MILSLVFIFLATISLSHQFPNGAPNGTCSTLTPKHHEEPQSTVSPYVLQLSQQRVTSGSPVKLMINSSDGRPFAGLMMRAQSLQKQGMGTFTTIHPDTKIVPCAPNAQHTLTHRNNNKKYSMEFEWESPEEYEGDIIFNATIVENYTTFWLNITSPIVKVVKRSVDTDGHSVGISTTRTPMVSTTTTPYYVPTEKKIPVKEDEFYRDCDVQKNCFGFPDGCVTNKDCSMVTSILVQGERYIFEMKAKDSVYVAVGLSDDKAMGDDSVVECTQDSPGNVQVHMSVNEGHSNRRIRQMDGVKMVDGSYVDGEIHCKFERDPVTIIENKKYDILHNKYHLLIASGKSLKESGISYHFSNCLASQEKSILADVREMSGSSKLYLRLHGAFMVAAWIGTASVGILLARYFKTTWVGSQLCGKDQWFAWHRMFMLLTWSLTIAGFVLIFIELQAWSSEKNNPHAILGTITTILAFLQPFGAALRPHPDAKRRPIFNWLHWLVGNLAYIIAIVAMFFAIRLTKAELPDWMDWILVGFVIFHVMVHLILSVASCISERKGSKRISSFPMKDMGSSRTPLASSNHKQDSPHAFFRKVLLGVYMIVIILFCAAVIVIIVLAPIEKNWEKFKKSLMSE